MVNLDALDEALSDFFRSIFASAAKPATLYHYTSQNAFLQIVNSSELWLSNIRHLNDPMEAVFGLDLMQRLVAKSKSAASIDEIISTYRQHAVFDSYLESIKPTYVMSFSSTPDRLADWVNYGDNGRGLSIAFARDKLVSLAITFMRDRQFLLLLPIYYFPTDRSHQDTANPGFIDSFAAYADRISAIIQSTSPPDLELLKPVVFESLTLVASLIKSDFHAEEAEWRLLIRLAGPDQLDNVETVYRGSLRTIYRLKLPIRITIAVAPAPSILAEVIERVYPGPGSLLDP